MQRSSSQFAPLSSFNLYTLTHLVRHLRRWLYTCVPVTGYWMKACRSLATALTWKSLNPLSVLTPSATRFENFSSTWADISGVQFRWGGAPLPCCAGRTSYTSCTTSPWFIWTSSPNMWKPSIPAIANTNINSTSNRIVKDAQTKSDLWQDN